MAAFVHSIWARASRKSSKKMVLWMKSLEAPKYRVCYHTYKFNAQKSFSQSAPHMHFRFVDESTHQLSTTGFGTGYELAWTLCWDADSKVHRPQYLWLVAKRRLKFGRKFKAVFKPPKEDTPNSKRQRKSQVVLTAAV